MFLENYRCRIRTWHNKPFKDEEDGGGIHPSSQTALPFTLDQHLLLRDISLKMLVQKRALSHDPKLLNLFMKY